MKFIYEVPVITPQKNVNPGGYGIETWLDGKFANIARGSKLETGMNVRLQDGAREGIKRFRLRKFGEVRNPYIFFEDSWLL